MSESTNTLVSHRMEQAQTSLDAARVLLEQQLLRPAAKRACSAMFYAILALLATKKERNLKARRRDFSF